MSLIIPRIFWALTVSNNSCKEETLTLREISLSYHITVVTLEEHELLLTHRHSEMNG